MKRVWPVRRWPELNSFPLETFRSSRPRTPNFPRFFRLRQAVASLTCPGWRIRTGERPSWRRGDCVSYLVMALRNCECGEEIKNSFRAMSAKNIYYSDKYDDELYEYRHVMLPKDIAKQVPKTHLMSETEWRNLGVQQSQGWVHYMIHEPEPHILLFRRSLPIKNP
ncbi:hypothetical protein XELAEV_18040898mg [Xenopus laevis]|uniref:Cyclin-dependent kinases regulatory subunit n=2 Tax=Xenopus laevis TaxID=8355 RepID=A0A974H9S1_XENLA|nr:hypothetical protein XELAEV_18040898mg [Xenopus laevis]